MIDVNEIMFNLISSKEQTYSDKQLKEIRRVIEEEIKADVGRGELEKEHIKSTYNRFEYSGY
jgi:hypothetical protein